VQLQSQGKNGQHLGRRPFSFVLDPADMMHAVFAERIEQAKAVEPPLPAPDGREIVRWVALPSFIVSASFK
jgi:hypothetical protein